MAQMEQVKRESNLRHYAMLFVMASGICLLPVQGAVGGCVLIAAAVINIITYFMRKGETSLYFTAMSYIIRMLNYAKEISGLEESALSEYTEKLKENLAKLQKLRQGAPIVAPQNVTSDMMSMFQDYYRMLFHTDLIKFNRMLNVFFKEKDAILEVFEIVGFLDAMCSVASFRTGIPYYTNPEFVQEKCFQTKEMYHPFLEKPVPASIAAAGSVLVTGSNASGKSTFLKSCAINAILAQTIHTVCAQNYRASFFRVMSSMALSDNLLGGESYYIVEIRSLKRILAAILASAMAVSFEMTPS